MRNDLSKIISEDLQEEKISLGDFAETYIEVAMDLAQNNPSLDEFDFYLREKVSKLTGMTHDAVKYMSHSFHWTFFVDGKNKGFDSPFNYINPEFKWESPRVNLSRFSLKDVSNLSNHLLKEYRTILSERWNILSNKFNISRQGY